MKNVVLLDAIKKILETFMVYGKKKRCQNETLKKTLSKRNLNAVKICQKYESFEET